MKTIDAVTRESGISAKLVRAVVRQTGKENLEDIARHGVNGGFAGFTYYSDTVPFFKRNRMAIRALVEQQAEDLGESPMDMVCGFGCLAGFSVHKLPEHAKRKALNEFAPSVARCLYGGTLTDEDTQVANALAWFAAEEVARAFHPDI